MQSRSRSVLRLESLESRLVPASSLWIDQDGDRVLFTTSKGDLAGHIAELVPDGVNAVFNVDISDPSFAGTNLNVSVTKARTGDGQVIVGHINAGSNDLGIVKIQGDLGDIDAGSSSVTVPAVRSLTVSSFGRFGLRGDGDYYSQVFGNVGSLVVKRDFIDTNFYVTGNLTSVGIGGSIIGGDAPGAGQIYATGNLGRVTIKHDVRGGDGHYSGSVGAGVNITSVTVGGSVFGGMGTNSGDIHAAYVSNGRIDRVTVGGSLVGGGGKYSGTIGGTSFNRLVSLGMILIGRDIIGGSGEFGGSISSFGGLSVDRLTVKGSLVGGAGDYSGYVFADFESGSVTIAGNVYGGSGISSASITGYRGLDSVTIGGSIIGGSAKFSGRVFVFIGGLNVLKIRGDVRGGSGEKSGSVDVTYGGITTKIIGGVVIKGIGVDSGTVTG